MTNDARCSNAPTMGRSMCNQSIVGYMHMFSLVSSTHNEAWGPEPHSNRFNGFLCQIFIILESISRSSYVQILF